MRRGCLVLLSAVVGCVAASLVFLTVGSPAAHHENSADERTAPALATSTETGQPPLARAMIDFGTPSSGTPISMAQDGSSPRGHDLADVSLRQRIHDMVKDHRRVQYSSSGPDTWDALSESDADPTNPGHVITLYCNRSVPCASRGNDCWEREHLWPRSLGDFQDEPCDYVFTDLFGLYPTESGINQARSNLPFGDCTARDCTIKRCDETTPENRMRGGDDGVWEVWAGRRGDVARALFYLDVRYEGGTHGMTGCPEPDLILTDDRSLTVSTSGTVAYMGMLTDLVRWHLEDPVDDLERMRNDIVEHHQGKRNPFVEHPEWVCEVWPVWRCSGPP